MTRLELLAALGAGGAVFIGGFGFLLTWALLHNVDRPARPDMTRLTDADLQLACDLGTCNCLECQYIEGTGRIDWIGEAL